MDYETQRCSRHCAVTGRTLEPGEAFYSALLVEGGQVLRRDFAVDQWQGPPEKAIGWWKSQVPLRDAPKMQLAPNDVMLELLEQLEHAPDKEDLRYVLSLLLIRRRVLRLEETVRDEQGRETAVLACPRRDKSYRVFTASPDDARAAELQAELSGLLFAKAN